MNGTPRLLRSYDSSEFQDSAHYRVCQVIAILAAAGQAIPIEVTLDRSEDLYNLYAESGELRILSKNRWKWTAPCTTGRCCLMLVDSAMQDIVYLEIIVIAEPDMTEALPALGNPSPVALPVV